MACASASVHRRSARALRVVASFLNFGSNHLPSYSPACGAEGGLDLPVVARHVLADLLLALDHDRQRRRLHAADGGEEEAAVARVEGGHRARAVDADQPVGLAAAARGVGQAAHLLRRCAAARSRRGSPAASCSAATGAGPACRRLALSPPAYCTIRRKISSPSRPASQALMSSVTSLRLTSLTTAFSRVLALSIGARSKCGGITGRWAKLHLPRLTSYSSGALISTRWPTAERDDVVLVLEVVGVLLELAGRRASARARCPARRRASRQ